MNLRDDGKILKLIPRLGRRGESNIQRSQEQDTPPDSPGSSHYLHQFSSTTKRPSSKGPAPIAPHFTQARRTGSAAWGDELKSESKHKSRTAAGPPASIASDRFLNDDQNLTDDGIPVIPDLDEIVDETGALDISNTCLKGLSRASAAAAYHELDSDLIKNKLFATSDGIDIRLLTEKLYPELLVKEPDQIWNWESLFTQVASEINSEVQSRVQDKFTL